MSGSDDRRGGDRHPVSMRIKLKYPDVQSFIERYSSNISRGGIFVQTKRPRPVGTILRFEFLLADQTRLIRGEGRVAWLRERDEAGEPAGMGVKYTRLDKQSRELIERALFYREQLAAAVGIPQGGDDPLWANVSSAPGGMEEETVIAPAEAAPAEAAEAARDGRAAGGRAPAPDPFAAPYLGGSEADPATDHDGPSYDVEGFDAPPGGGEGGGGAGGASGEGEREERTVVNLDAAEPAGAVPGQTAEDLAAAARAPDDIDLELEAAFTGIIAMPEATGDVPVLLAPEDQLPQGEDLSFTAPPLTAPLGEAGEDEGGSEEIALAADDLIEDFEIPAAEGGGAAPAGAPPTDADAIEAALEGEVEAEETTTTTVSSGGAPATWLDPAAEPSVPVPVQSREGGSWHGPGEAGDGDGGVDEETEWRLAREAAERRAAEEESARLEANAEGAARQAAEARASEAERARVEAEEERARAEAAEEDERRARAAAEESRQAGERAEAELEERRARERAADAESERARGREESDARTRTDAPREPSARREGTGRSRSRASRSEVQGAPRPDVRASREEEEEQRTRALEEQFAREEGERRTREDAERAARDRDWREKIEAERIARDHSREESERADERRRAARESERAAAREEAKRAARVQAEERARAAAASAAAALRDAQNTVRARPVVVAAAPAYTAEDLARFDGEIQTLIAGLDGERMAAAAKRARALVGDRPAETLAAWLEELSAPRPPPTPMTPEAALAYLRGLRVGAPPGP